MSPKPTMAKLKSFQLVLLKPASKKITPKLHFYHATKYKASSSEQKGHWSYILLTYIIIHDPRFGQCPSVRPLALRIFLV